MIDTCRNTKLRQGNTEEKNMGNIKEGIECGQIHVLYIKNKQQRQQQTKQRMLSTTNRFILDIALCKHPKLPFGIYKTHHWAPRFPCHLNVCSYSR